LQFIRIWYNASCPKLKSAKGGEEARGKYMGSPKGHHKQKAKKALERKIKIGKASSLIKRAIQFCAAPIIVIERANNPKNPSLGA